MVNVIPRLEFLLQSVFLSQRQCPHCRSKELTTVARKYLFIQIKRCKNCHLYFTSPIYQTKLFSELYEGLYGGGVNLTTQLPSFEELDILKRKKFKESEKDFSQILQGCLELCTGEEKKMLEIGASWGYLLYQAKEYGFDGTGIEIDEVRSKFGIKHLGVSIVKDFEALKEEQFDIVVSVHTLEHLTDLSEIFRKIYGHLKSGGKAFFAVPNFDWDQFGNKNLSTIGAVHPLGFSARFFKKNLPRYGFKAIGIYGDTKDFPHKPAQESKTEGLLVLAEKDL